jgi:hypothetical protein
MGVRRRQPQAGDAVWRYAEAALWFGEDHVAALWPQAKGTFQMVDDPIPITLLTADIVDIFLPGHPFDQQQLQRRIAQPVDDESGRMLQVASAEDTVVAKLERYQITPSDRQWRDVQAILRVQAGALDHAYLRHWAAELSVGELLEVALRGEHPPGPDPRQQRLF